mgnify:CR=1 FL=1
MVRACQKLLYIYSDPIYSSVQQLSLTVTYMFGAYGSGAPESRAIDAS